MVRHKARRDLTGLSKRKALELAKTLLPRAKAGDLDDAALLVDVAIYAGQIVAAERLQLALQGRTPHGSVRSPAAAARNLEGTLELVTRSLFPPRAKPCMPSRRELVNLLSRSLDVRDRSDRALARDLWKALETACRSGTFFSVTRAMQRANDALRGEGVEFMTVETRRSPPVGLSFDFVNLDDSDEPTLVYDYYATRFRIASWGSMVEAWERRWGRL